MKFTGLTASVCKCQLIPFMLFFLLFFRENLEFLDCLVTLEDKGQRCVT